MDRDNGFQTIAQIVSGLDWIAVNRPDVRVVNMSLGTFQRFAGNCDSANAGTVALASAVAALRARGVTVFASSLNDAQPASMTAPACLSGVIAVGAVYDSALGPITYPNICADQVTAADRVTCFSNGGSELDLLAPGALIASTGRGGGVSTFAGTSQASPHAAGAAALLLQRDATLTPDAIESTLETTGVPITDARNGRTTPRIDLAAALQAPAPELPPAVADILVGRDVARLRRRPSRPAQGPAAARLEPRHGTAHGRRDGAPAVLDRRGQAAATRGRRERVRVRGVLSECRAQLPGRASR